MNQELFINVIDLLSPFQSTYKPQMMKIVKLSIQTNLDETDLNTKIGDQYKFTTTLSSVLQDMHNQETTDSNLRKQLELIFARIHKQEDKLKTQLSLKFV